MSLVLGVSKGDKIFLNNMVLNIVNASISAIDVELNGETYSLDDVSFKEIFTDVFAAVGKPRYECSKTVSRIAIDAPRSVKILRESNRNHASNY